MVPTEHEVRKNSCEDLSVQQGFMNMNICIRKKNTKTVYERNFPRCQFPCQLDVLPRLSVDILHAARSCLGRWFELLGCLEEEER